MNRPVTLVALVLVAGCHHDFEFLDIALDAQARDTAAADARPDAARDAAPDTTVIVPDVVAPQPDVVVVTPDVVAPGPDGSPPAPDVVVTAPDVIAPSPDVIVADAVAPGPDALPPDSGACPGGQTLCSGVCTSTRTDVDHCGACDNACGPLAEGCVAGACQCAVGYAICNNRCVDYQTDQGNCGGCGHACGASADLCSNGSCGCSAPAIECHDPGNGSPSCFSCPSGQTPYCTAHMGNFNQCCGAARPRFCDVAGVGSGCTEMVNDCATLHSCTPGGPLYTCPPGFHVDCSGSPHCSN